jgi:hypothetical protein
MNMLEHSESVAYTSRESDFVHKPKEFRAIRAILHARNYAGCEFRLRNANLARYRMREITPEWYFGEITHVIHTQNIFFVKQITI